MKFLSGWKTYISAAVIFILGGLLALKVIDQSTFNILITVFASLGLASLRSAINSGTPTQ